MRFLLEALACGLFFLLGHRAGRNRVKKIMNNWITHRVIESQHRLADKLYLPTLEALKQKLREI